MKVTTDDVRRLATMSRVALTDVEVQKMQGEIESIVAYIDAVQQVPMPEGVSPSPHLELVNVMRDDGVPHATGEYTDALLAQAPARQGDFIKVKKILG